MKFPFVIILYTQNWYSITKVMLLLNWPLGIVVQLLQWRIRPLWHVYERDKLLSWLQKKITITRLRVHTRQVIDIIIAPCMCGVVNRTPFKIGTIPILRQHVFGLFWTPPTHLININTVLNVSKTGHFLDPLTIVILLTLYRDDPIARNGTWLNQFLFLISFCRRVKQLSCWKRK